ncbi:MAG: hypothetical protein H7X88_06835 [Gloeobacteraceae cyanobacterium ES-bin-316]|nr:hypothetical protein [Ferruginibacter sp.]
MALETMFEKLQFTDQKHLLIQGLPSTIEKQFSKVNFCKSVTPLLRNRKIDFALVFAVSRKQLTNIVDDVIPALQDQGKFWVAYPKLTAKIASDLCRDVNWDMITHYGYEPESQVVLDNVWSAMKFRKIELQPKIPARSKRSAMAVEV